MADNCAAIKTKLDSLIDLLDSLLKPGVRSVQDSDGSRIEYTSGNVSALQKRIAQLQLEYDNCCGRRYRARPFGHVFP